MIKCLLKRHRYPPEGMDDAVQTVMTQCELWTDNNDMESAYAPLRRLRHGICVAKMLDKTSSIICAFGLAAAAPRSPYRHLELCGIALGKIGLSIRHQ